MSRLDHRILSIGALAAHPLWNESTPVRTGHATCTLIEAGDARIVVDPGLPAAALAARMSERTPVTPADVTHVFVTTFTADHYRGIQAFEDATWFVHEPERLGAGALLREQVDRARDAGDDEGAERVEQHLALLERCRDAPDRLVDGVDLFPLPGLSPGTCGLLLPLPLRTVLLAGDAVATKEHADRAQILPGCLDVEQAMESFKEAIEIADEIVPGRDNAFRNPARQGF